MYSAVADTRLGFFANEIRKTADVQLSSLYDGLALNPDLQPQGGLITAVHDCNVRETRLKRCSRRWDVSGLAQTITRGCDRDRHPCRVSRTCRNQRVSPGRRRSAMRWRGIWEFSWCAELKRFVYVVRLAGATAKAAAPRNHFICLMSV